MFHYIDFNETYWYMVNIARQKFDYVPLVKANIIITWLQFNICPDECFMSVFLRLPSLIFILLYSPSSGSLLRVLFSFHVMLILWYFSYGAPFSCSLASCIASVSRSSLLLASLHGCLLEAGCSYTSPSCPVQKSTTLLIL